MCKICDVSKCMLCVKFVCMCHCEQLHEYMFVCACLRMCACVCMCELYVCTRVCSLACVFILACLVKQTPLLVAEYNYIK